jgi:hypothetical protein
MIERAEVENLQLVVPATWQDSSTALSYTQCASYRQTQEPVKRWSSSTVGFHTGNLPCEATGDVESRVVSSTDGLAKFLEAARAQGLGEEALVGLLKGRGWPEDDAYRAVADYYEAQTGIPIPAYKRAGSAKDAFLYLLVFALLATWTIAVGTVLFTLIERWLKDPLAPNTYYSFSYYQIADSLACIIVAFPIYLLVTLYILREQKAHPEKLGSPVRKWLTYIALLIAAGVVVGDVITFLTYVLRGELTSRFVAKTAVVLVIAGGVFWYYLGSLQEGRAAPKTKS